MDDLFDSVGPSVAVFRCVSPTPAFPQPMKSVQKRYQDVPSSLCVTVEFLCRCSKSRVRQQFAVCSVGAAATLEYHSCDRAAENPRLAAEQTSGGRPRTDELMLPLQSPSSTAKPAYITSSAV
eukprot:SAG31_NODE_7397_length_1700_cov_2.505934_2_plen_123_part_00